MFRFALLLLVLLVCPFSAGAQTATITDGDTLKIGGAVYGSGESTPPSCTELVLTAGRAGRLATSHVLELIGRRSTVCQAKGTDRYGRTIAICRSGGADVGAAMVRDGMALAFTRYSRDYVSQEEAAKRERKGLHAHNWLPPWEWRAERR